MTNIQNAADALRNLSNRDFRNFGNDHIGYIRPVTVENRNAYALYAADGRILTIQDTADLAQLVARHNGLEPLLVH